jgi:hypothetical protein
MFSVGNPFDAAKTFDLIIGQADMSHARVVASEFRVAASDMAVRMRLLDAQGAPVSDQGTQAIMRVQLGPLESRRLQLEVETSGVLPDGQGIVLESRLLDPNQDVLFVGSLGTVLLGS